MRILALDVGERRTGVAVSDPSGTVARPLTVIEHRSRNEEMAAVADLVAEHDIELIVVGCPLTLRGESGPQAQLVQQYAATLAEKVPVEVQLWDERYSTVTAAEIIRQTRKRGKRHGKKKIDAIAAAVILQGFLDSRAEPLPPDYPVGDER